MKVLITGGCGFVGSNLAAMSIARGDSLFILDNLFRKGSDLNLDWLKTKGDFKYYADDIRNSDRVDCIIKKIKPDYIFHLAGQVAMTTSIAHPRTDFEINALGTLNILEAVRKYSPESIVIYSSTNKVYGELEYFTYKETSTRYVCVEHTNGFNESVKLDFRSPYGCSKGTADQYLLDYYRMFGIKTVVFRHSSMYGGNQHATYDQGWIGWFCQKAFEINKGILKDPFTISGNGKQVRDVLHSSDVADLYFLAAQSIERVMGQVYNIGGGINNSLSLLELFLILEEKLDIKMNYSNVGWRESDQLVFVADISKITNAVGWEPKTGMKVGINKIMTEKLKKYD